MTSKSVAEIEIYNNKAVLFRKGRKGKRKVMQVAVSKLTKKITEGHFGKLNTTPILPAGVRCYRRKGKVEAVVVELPPQVRTIGWDDESEYNWDDEKREFTVAFPYVILILVFFEGTLRGHPKVYYRNEPIRSLEDKLFFTNLKNLHGKNGVCLGGIELSSARGLSYNVKEIVEAFWNREFNNELNSNSRLFARRGPSGGVANIERWEKLSAKDPSFVLRIRWPAAKLTLERAIELEMGNYINYNDRSEHIHWAKDLADLMYQTKEVGQCSRPI